MTVRQPAVAGTFYPADRHALLHAVDGFLAAAAPPPLAVAPKMLIVPHAGYVFSGPIAATAYVALDGVGVDAVLMLGPSHFVGFAGLATPEADGFLTPLGTVAIDPVLRTAAAPWTQAAAAPHRREHSLEVQLPFLQRLLPTVPCLPVLTGDDDPEPGAALLADTLTRPGVLVVVSSDLSHYLDHETAQREDAETAQAIVDLRPAGVGPRSACGRTAVQAALRAAAARGWTCQLLDLRTSGDTAGDRGRVVGYGAFVLGPRS